MSASGAVNSLTPQYDRMSSALVCGGGKESTARVAQAPNPPYSHSRTISKFSADDDMLSSPCQTASIKGKVTKYNIHRKHRHNDKMT